MSDHNTQTRKVALYLPIEHSRFLDQERVRLEEVTGKPWSPSEIIQLLIVQHKTRMEMKAERDPSSVGWMYRLAMEQAG